MTEKNFAHHIIGDSSGYKTIDKTLDVRCVKAEYPYSGLFRLYLLMALFGSDL